MTLIWLVLNDFVDPDLGKILKKIGKSNPKLAQITLINHRRYIWGVQYIMLYNVIYCIYIM